MPSTAIDPLWTMSGASVRRKADGQPVELGVAREVLDVADRVDVALDEMSAEPAVGAQRPLEIHRGAARQRSERRHAQRLGPDVGVNLAVLRQDDRQADAVDREAVARRQLRASGDAIRRRKPPLVGLRSTSSPTASTRPVNISLYQHIRTERLDPPLDQLRGRETRDPAETARRRVRARAA